MVTKDKLYIDKALNELILAEFLHKISVSKKDKVKNELSEDIAFFSQIITHSYYSIFYTAKSILFFYGFETKAPGEHKKTIDLFEKELIEIGKLDLNLFELYKEVVIEAQFLLEIFIKEKKNRGSYTYHKLPQANQYIAEISLKNAKLFFKHINGLIE